jgi:hypothetical protein
MLFREHKGGLFESMQTCVDVKDIDALYDLLSSRLSKYGHNFTRGQMSIKPYGYDERIGWHANIVTIDGYGVAGFTDSLL